MKDKLKRIYNSKSLWIIILCLVQIVPVLANWYYYTKTNYCCDIYITSPTDCEVSFVTPMGTKYTQKVSANVEFHEYKRPLADIYAPKCSMVHFLSYEISLSDIFIFTMKVKHLGLLWIALTCLSLIPFKENLKRIYNSKIMWIIILCLVQIVPVLANWYYYTKTNYCCDIYITSPTDCEVLFVTPTDNTYTENVSANETFREYKRPLVDVRAPECAKVEFSSDEVQVLDVLKFTMKNIFWLWIVLTYMSILRIFMKV